jgi:hypothetical protein
VPDLGKPRFIAFISRHEEMKDYTGLCPEADFVFLTFSDLDTDAMTIDPRRMDESIETLRLLHKQSPFTAVLNRKEKCVVPAATIASALNLPPITCAPELARDKFAMRHALNGGRNFPRTILVRDAADLEVFEPGLFPCVLKPRFGFNSRSAVMVKDRNELEEAYREQHKRYAALHKQDGTNSDFVVEELISGSEHNVESLVKDGTALFHLVSDKLPMTRPFFVEVGDNMPSRLSSADQELCGAATDRAIQAMGIRNGWTHTEVKLDGDKTTVVECAARMGGGYFENLFQEVYGINRMKMLMDLFLDSAAVEHPTPRQHAAARRIVVYGPASARKLTGAAQIFDGAVVKLIWPSAVSQIDRELAGPPHDFNNTLCEFVVLGPQAVETADNIVAGAVLRNDDS